VEAHWISNLTVVALVAFAVFALRRAGRSDLWRQAGRELLQRRPLALGVFGLFAAIALGDSIAWRSEGVGEGFQPPRSLVDRVVPADFAEASYSAPFAEVEFYGGAPLKHPGRHWLGTDILGRDVLHQALKGARVALLVGGLTSAVAIPLALLFGVAAGYRGGRTDDLVFFAVSTLASIPSLLLLIVLIMVMGRGALQVCVALGVTSWVGLCRVVRGETLKLRELDYVAAARALGSSEWNLVWRHVVPNLMHLVVITFVLLFSGMVLSESVLAWLGLGLEGSWGQMIDQARDELARDPVIWWNLAAASGFLFALILAVNLIGDAVRDVLDPRTLRDDA
jgi:peptide/nickel transport system permease protein